MDEKTITITKTKYEYLKRSEQKLNALEAAGVDNWDGYDLAMEWMEHGDE